ncbi:hypothetical protein ASPZODRAFT_152274 [Penicilliopsis zonata CBS 506.65]|uniref:Autophagy-related protein n=1 Tax=Penicilliopsis zonata CBS 506.65 TaxID=1073090 RepID=A0A1L9SG71_9EURO|nr:hypothetical protein ASPZODRAFT_152274 [Penicilliopsis zonata CBS 506.65]OJJ46034.1 hypothetical protein ASPZODRAFT_152274 [Penicilliopsis zonata CBS 506.65]
MVQKRPSSPPPPEEDRLRPPRYAAEDTTPTRRVEILGWYAYGIAAEVFAVCGVGSFLPITLEQLARERGTFLNSHLPCVPTSVSAGGNGTHAMTRGGDENGQCVVDLFGMQINTASFAMYTFSLAVLVQALTLISFSALADYGTNRKTMLLIFGFLGSTTCMMFIFVAPPVFLLGSILAIIGVTCLGSSFVVLNSFLPLLVAHDPSIHHAKLQRASRQMYRHDDDEEAEEHEAVNDVEDEPDADPKKKKGPVSPEMQLSTQISSKGVGLGYSAAMFVQCLSILLLFCLSKTSLSKTSATLPLRFVLFLVGVWWFGGTMVTRRWLRSRPGPPLDSSTAGGNRDDNRLSQWRASLRMIGFAWKSLWRTVKIAAKLREMVIFLVAWFLLSDAIATVSGTAILFARTELKMSTEAVAMLSITAMVSGMAGAFLWPIISRRFNLQSNHTIMACIALFELIPIYGMMGYVPLFKRWGVIGLQQPWEIYPLGFIHGFVSGGLNSYCRSFFGQLIPPGNEAAFYALYAVTDKGSSVVGPAIVGGLIDATGSVRSGFFFIAVLILLPIPLIAFVNMDKGRRDGIAMAEKLEGDARRDQEEEEEGLLRGQRSP